MFFALSEGVGSLVGIVIIYPTYQWSIDEKTSFYAGSLLYVFCGVSVDLCHTYMTLMYSLKTKLNYAAIAAVVWRFFGKSHQQETEA
jgi:hypothetical protein